MEQFRLQIGTWSRSGGGILHMLVLFKLLMFMFIFVALMLKLQFIRYIKALSIIYFNFNSICDFLVKSLVILFGDFIRVIS